MLNHLAAFDINEVGCSKEFDREFIFSSIARWHLDSTASQLACLQGRMLKKFSAVGNTTNDHSRKILYPVAEPWRTTQKTFVCVVGVSLIAENTGMSNKHLPQRPAVMVQSVTFPVC